MLIKQKETVEFNPYEPSSIIALLKAREDDNIFIIDFYHHPRNTAVRTNYESILRIRDLLTTREQVRRIKEERILSQAGHYTAQNEDATKYHSNIV